MTADYRDVMEFRLQRGNYPNRMASAEMEPVRATHAQESDGLSHHNIGTEGDTGCRDTDLDTLLEKPGTAIEVIQPRIKLGVQE
ncbi:unnamed protein product [Lampetra planeri]